MISDVPFVVSKRHYINLRLLFLISMATTLVLALMLYIQFNKPPQTVVEIKTEVEYVASYVPEYQKLDIDTVASLTCLAKNIYHEARGDITGSKYGVAFVTRNRVQSDKFPSEYCDVVYQARKGVAQFSWTNDGLTDETSDETSFNGALMVAYNVMFTDVVDITDGALYYHRNDGKTKFSDAHYEQISTTGSIGEHVYYVTKN